MTAVLAAMASRVIPSGDEKTSASHCATMEPPAADGTEHPGEGHNERVTEERITRPAARTRSKWRTWLVRRPSNCGTMLATAPAEGKIMATRAWTDADTQRALEIWREDQQHHDVSALHGKAVGIDIVSGRAW